MIRALAFLLALLPIAAVAEDWPALYDVTGVTPGDVLNVRAAPNVASEKIGGLDHGATGIEVIRAEGNWGLVNLGERSGWAHLRYLARQPAGAFPLAQRLSCAGTEPFWSLDITQDDIAVLTIPGTAPVGFHTGPLQASSNAGDRFMLRADPLIAFITRGACSDGMSDRTFGLTVDFVPDLRTNPGFFSGCCSLTGN